MAAEPLRLGLNGSPRRVGAKRKGGPGGESSDGSSAGSRTLGAVKRARALPGPGAEKSAPPAPSAWAPGAGKPAFRWAPGESERVSLYPIRHPDLWDCRKTLEGLRWTAQSVDLKRDKLQWLSLADHERHTLAMQLAFFAQIDNLIFRNLDNFRDEVDCLEARMAFSEQETQECVHMESYGLQIQALMDGDECARTLEATRHLPVVASMHSWIQGALSRAKRPLGERMVAATFAEGVLFCASFAIMQWARERNVLPGVTEANSYIARDENTHTGLTALLVREYLVEPPPAAAVARIFDEGLRVVDEFVEASLPSPLTGGVDAKKMREYVRFQADSALSLMGYERLYSATNPFKFMDKLALNAISKSNFFEEPPTQYQYVTAEGAARLRIGPGREDEGAGSGR